MWHGGIFIFTSLSLLISIVRTIFTNPGNIPDHKEWDMSTDQSAGEDLDSGNEVGLNAPHTA
jgi:hypothetical protein